MEALLGFTCLSTVSVAGIARLMLWVTDKSAAGAITQHFQAAEYILQHHQPPPSWINQSHSIALSRIAKRSQPTILDRLDRLILYFEHSRFFETEDARTVLLEQLQDVRKSWIQQY